MKYISAVALLVAGLIHLLPVAGVLGGAALTGLYGIEVADPNTSILLQHRALLFGLLAVLMLVAVSMPRLRVTVMGVAFFSTASFVTVALMVGGYNVAVARVVTVDVAASVLLAVGLGAELWRGRRGG
jgi:hypothetical protein